MKTDPERGKANTDAVHTNADHTGAVWKAIGDRGLLPENLIPLLQDIQEGIGYIPLRAVEMLAEELGVSRSHICGVATFYSQFRSHRPGRYRIRVCQGTACHVSGGGGIVSEVKRRLGIESEETTADGMFSLGSVACMGCCALAPVMVIDEKIHGKMSSQKLEKLLDSYRKEGSGSGEGDARCERPDMNEENARCERPDKNVGNGRCERPDMNEENARCERPDMNVGNGRCERPDKNKGDGRCERPDKNEEGVKSEKDVKGEGGE